MGAGLLVGTALAVIIPEGIHTLILAQHNTPARHHQHSDPFEQSVLKVSSSPSSIAGGVLGVPAKMYDPPHEQGHAHSGESSEAEALSSVGLALVLGFIFMLLVDQCSRSASSSRGGGDLESSSSLSHAKKSFTATLGLVVHAAGRATPIFMNNGFKLFQTLNILFFNPQLTASLWVLPQPRRIPRLK